MIEYEQSRGPIDSDILPLLEDLNEAGYKTLMSCSGDSRNHPKSLPPTRHPRAAWVMFKDLKEGMLTEDIREELDTIIKSHTNVPYILKGSKRKRSPQEAKIRSKWTIPLLGAKVNIIFDGPIS